MQDSLEQLDLGEDISEGNQFPKLYYNVFLFVDLKTFETFI